MVQNNLTAKDIRERAEELSFPSSVVEFMQGQLGQVKFLFVAKRNLFLMVAIWWISRTTSYKNVKRQEED
jgi:pyruvate carboxylase